MRKVLSGIAALVLLLTAVLSVSGSAMAEGGYTNPVAPATTVQPTAIQPTPVSAPLTGQSGPYTNPLAPAGARSLTVTVVGRDGRVLSAAAVQLMIPGRPEFRIMRTNAKGQAIFALPAGFSFWIRTFAEGYRVMERAYVPASDGPALTLNLTAWSGSLVGLVTDEEALPIAGARVSAWVDGLGKQAEVTTDSTGVYHLEGLQARGGYTLQVEAKGYQPYVATDLTVAPDSRAQVDAALTPATGTVTGEVVSSRTKRPVKDVAVELILNGWGVIARTTTDTYGYFQFAAPPWNEDGYQVRFSAPGYETQTSALFAVTPGGWNDFSGGNRISLNPLYATFAGSVLDQNGQPMPNTLVELQRTGLGAIEQSTTSADGFFAFAKLPAGTYRVRAVPTSDREHGATDWVTLNGGDRANADVSANDPDKTSYGSSAIVGTVVDHLNEPVEGATVKAVRGIDIVTATTDSAGRYRLAVQANIEADVDPETSSGYRVSVTKEGFIPTDLQQLADGANPPAFVDVRAKATNRADFTLQPAQAELAGRVLDEKGRAVIGAAVLLIQEGVGKVSTVSTDAYGRYHFPALPVAKQARYLPVVTGSGYFESSITPDGGLIAPTTPSPGGAATYTLTVRPSVTRVRGIVRAGENELAAGTLVRLLRPADGMNWTATVGQGGSYEIAAPAVPGWQYLVRAEYPGAFDGTVAESVDPGSSLAVTANLSVAKQAEIVGRVYRPDGKPAANALVTLWQENGQTAERQVRTDADGNYRFDGLFPGRRWSVILQSGPNNFTSLAPGELILTPLLTTTSGQTIWADLSDPGLTPLP